MLFYIIVVRCFNNHLCSTILFSKLLVGYDPSANKCQESWHVFCYFENHGNVARLLDTTESSFTISRQFLSRCARKLVPPHIQTSH